MEINIKNMDKSEILRRLYNNSKPQGMGILHFDPTPMTYEQAEDILSKSHDKYFDYLKGRVMKIDLSGEMMDTWLYDRDNGQGSVKMVLEDMEGFSICE
jgi:hypothetical protein